MAEPNREVHDDLNVETPLAAPTVTEANTAGRPQEIAPSKSASTKPAPTITQDTQSNAQARENLTAERILTRPDIPDVDITILYTPAERIGVAADIVFVHGLMGRPLKTWLYGKVPKKPVPENDKGRNGMNALEPSFFSKTLGGRKEGKRNQAEEVEADEAGANAPSCFWPFDLVPKDFGNVRVMTYGHDSDPTHWYKTKTTRMTITQHAQQLLNRVNRERIHCRQRPLIFVAHSLGGILVKDAII